MESSMKIQMDVKNNAQELRNYMLELNSWEEEMKKKELVLNNEKPLQTTIPPPRNKIKRSKQDIEKNYSNKPKKISAYDYSAWDKFDVEKACAQIDEEDSEEIIEEEETNKNKSKESVEEIKFQQNEDNNKNLSLIDEAFYEKEMGNQFVKKGQWSDAINCYTKAIDLDSKNAIYYANRSLCFLKLKNLKSAETDATTAVQLDENYVKAYQRRAVARLALGQLAEAKSDYEKILKLEPNNSSAKTEISRIDEKLSKGNVVPPVKKKTFDHKNIFKSEENKPENLAKTHEKKESKTCKNIFTLSHTSAGKKATKNNESKSECPTVVDIREEVKLENKIETSEEGDGDKNVPVKAAAEEIPQVFKPLPDWCKIVEPVHIPPHKRSKNFLRRIEIKLGEEKESLDFSGNVQTKSEVSCIKNEEKMSKVENKIEQPNERISFEAPKTTVQFQNCWKVVKKNPEQCYSYLKKISGKELVNIFENSLESDFFSELITFLASDNPKKESEFVYDFLLGLSKVKRFSSLTMFMSEHDRECVKKCIRELEKVEAKDQIAQLIKLYELKI